MLPRFDAIVHHGGAGVTCAAIAAAKPSLVVPHDFDQFDYAARVEHFGLGLRARRIGSADAARKLRRILDGPWPAVARFAAHAAAYRPVQSFLEAVAQEIGPAREAAA
jgi:UDP:flavonoid glycosyltransferase YjiC (YdhE family)